VQYACDMRITVSNVKNIFQICFQCINDTGLLRVTNDSGVVKSYAICMDFRPNSQILLENYVILSITTGNLFIL
jgi:hypothetical protein